jgi:hypothetical protein
MITPFVFAIMIAALWGGVRCHSARGPVILMTIIERNPVAVHRA